MSHSRQFQFLALFFVGWVTFSFSLFDVGPFSVTILLATTTALAVYGFRFGSLFAASTISVLLSGCLAWLVAVFIYADNAGKAHTHLLQHLLAVAVLIAAQSLDWDHFLPRFRKMFLWLSGMTLAYAVYQYFARAHGLPFAFLPITNLQISTYDGLQRGAALTLAGASGFSRVSSFFAEPSDLGRFMLWAVALGYGSTRDWLGVALIGVGVAGILVSQSMGGLIGLVVLISVIGLLKRDFQSGLVFLVMGAVLVSAFVLFFPGAVDSVATRAELIATEREHRLLQRGRFAYLDDNTEVFLEAPIMGHGLASIKRVIPDNVVASSIMLLLIERGIVGSLLFFVPFLWAVGKLGYSGAPADPVRCTALGILFVEVYCFSTFSQVYFQPIYLALGCALYAHAHALQGLPTKGRRDMAMARNGLTVNRGIGRRALGIASARPRCPVRSIYRRNS